MSRHPRNRAGASTTERHPYDVARSILGPPLRRCFPARVEGLHRLPTEGPVVLAPNHLSIMDSIILASVVPRRMSFIAKIEHFEDWRSGWAMRLTGQIPLDRGNGLAAGRALADAGRVLSEGGVVTIYPEGTRSRDGKLHHGNTGPARLAVGHGVPVIPIGLIGTPEVHAPGESLPHLFREVTVRVGAPIVPDPDDRRPRRKRIGSLTDQVMQSIADLSGQECAADWYRHEQELVPA